MIGGIYCYNFEGEVEKKDTQLRSDGIQLGHNCYRCLPLLEMDLFGRFLELDIICFALGNIGKGMLDNKLAIYWRQDTALYFTANN